MLTEYELLWFRELEQESKIWGTPAIALTAQAFLFTVAFAPGSSFVARVATASLAILVSFASIQLMSKHFLLAHFDQERMKDIDKTLCRVTIAERGWDTFEWRAAHGIRARNRWFIRLKARILWQVLFFIFAVVAAGVIVISLVAPNLLSSP